ncbi:MAG: NAD-dependent dehydratase [Naasia sp.]|nr:NAD-dependent dehydratase [Naasia sp.]
MTALKVLMVGGTGTISTAVTREALRRGHEVTLLNRGSTTKRPVPDGARVLQADVADADAVRAALGDQTFDAVVDWVVFTPDQVDRDVALFERITRQYMFISSASTYQTPPRSLPVRESTPLHNPFWQYSRNKIACEEKLLGLYRERGFPVTIVRPSHTYDETSLPIDGGWTAIDRMRRGKGVVVHGDGTSLWTLTSASDFAVGFVGLLGREAAIGEAFHITNESPVTWNTIVTLLARAAGVDEPDIVHVPSDAIAAIDAGWGASLLGDKTHSMVFDNSKLRALVPEFNPVVPFDVGAREMIAWFDADPARQKVDERMDGLFDILIERYRPRPL